MCSLCAQPIYAGRKARNLSRANLIASPLQESIGWPSLNKPITLQFPPSLSDSKFCLFINQRAFFRTQFAEQVLSSPSSLKITSSASDPSDLPSFLFLSTGISFFSSFFSCLSVFIISCYAWKFCVKFGKFW